MTITAKYAATCPACSQPIRVGDKVEWAKGAKARHTVCGQAMPAHMFRAAPAARSRSRRPGRWTGCSCGSREDSAGDLIESSRNCASCEHDA